ncbi:MAG TPA: hypothetical protein VGL21_04265 [Jatrophihabitantaceae bacterium]|jgi:hypothetical protein
MVSAGAYVYPWDVVGDPAAASRIAELGVTDAVLAAAYHTTRALTPLHPRHRIVVAQHAAAYYPPDPGVWKGRRLQPGPATWVDGPDSFGTAAAALRTAGLNVQAWVVLAHNTRLGEQFPDVAVRNAYGDVYPWALCIAQDDVREYAITLVGEIGDRDDLDGFELEACGWYGYDHQSAHDKSTGVKLTAFEEYLFSLCFCPACARAYADVGVAADELRTTVRTRLDATFAGTTPIEFDAALAEAVARMRIAVSARFRADVVAAARPHRTLVHAHPDPLRYGANVGVDLSRPVADGLVLNCWRDVDEADAAITTATKAGHRVAASFLAVGGMGGDLAGLPSRVERARAAGAEDLRFYHAGLAAPADLEALRALPVMDKDG